LHGGHRPPPKGEKGSFFRARKFLGLFFFFRMFPGFFGFSADILRFSSPVFGASLARRGGVVSLLCGGQSPHKLLAIHGTFGGYPLM
jgi:hypothetical protein